MTVKKTEPTEPTASFEASVREVCAHPDGKNGTWLAVGFNCEAVNGGITLPLAGDLAPVLYPTRRVRIDVTVLDD